MTHSRGLKKKCFRHPHVKLIEGGYRLPEGLVSLSAKDVNWLVLVSFQVAGMWFAAVMMGNLGNVKKPSYCFVTKPGMYAYSEVRDSLMRCFRTNSERGIFSLLPSPSLNECVQW